MFFDNQLTRQVKDVIAKKEQGHKFDAVDIAREIYGQEKLDYRNQVKPIMKELAYIAKTTNNLAHIRESEYGYSRNVFFKLS